MEHLRAQAAPARMTGLIRWLPLLITLGLLAATVLLWQSLLREERQDIRRTVGRELTGVCGEIAARLTSRIMALDRMARRMELHPTAPQEWAADAGLYLQHYPGYQAIEWADASLRVQGVIPLAGNEAEAGRDLAADPQMRPALEALRQGGPTLVLPLDLGNGERGFMVVVPFRRGDRLGGLIRGLFRDRELIADVTRYIAPGYSVSVVAGGQEVFSRVLPPAPSSPDWVREQPLQIGRLHWLVRVSPSADSLSSLQSPLPHFALLLGLAMSLVSGVAAYLAQTARIRAAQLAAANAALQVEIRRREQAEEQHARLAAVLEATPDFVSTTDAAGRVLFYNAAARALLGISEHQDLSSARITDNHPEWAAQLILNHGLPTAARSGVWRGDTAVLSAGGHEIPLSHLILAHKSSGGEVQYFSTIARDISHRKQTEAELRQRAQQQAVVAELGQMALRGLPLQELMDAAVTRVAASLSVEYSKVLELLPSGNALLLRSGVGWRPGLVGTATVGTGADSQAGYTLLSHEPVVVDDLRRETRFTGPPLLHEHGVISGLSVIISGERGPYGVLGAHTIRQRHFTRDEVNFLQTFANVLAHAVSRAHAEGEIRRMNAELEMRVAARTAELEETVKELEAFTYSVSHDLRSPLRQISGFARIVLEDFGPSLPAQAHEHLRLVEDGARRMGILIDDLLNLSRVGRRELHPQLTGFHSLVREAIGDLEPETRGRDIEWRIGELPFAECDPALMKQVWANLLSNAAKFTRPRQHAVIEVGQKQIDGAKVLFVRDNGVGFSMKYVDKLFGVFQRLHRVEDFEGTGVGLATVQRILYKHGGRIWAEAELDKGACFYFTLGAPEERGRAPANTQTEEIAHATQ